MGKILVVGANGVLGQTLIKFLGPAVAVAGTRRQDWGDDVFDHISLANDEHIKAIDWQNFCAVINVAGRVHGNTSELLDANVTFPTKLALAARAGNVVRFVQVSSFAVYGYAEYIDDKTPEAPASDYGHTKAEGDRQLHALATDTFSVASLRLPFLFDADRPALFRQLFNAIKMLPYFPVTASPTMRSMISYTDAALTLKSLVVKRGSGIYHAAAPTLFTFALLGRLLLEESNFRFRTVQLPRVVMNAIKIGAPAIHRRLFLSNVLNPAFNIVSDVADIHDIEAPLRSLVRKRFG